MTSDGDAIADGQVEVPDDPVEFMRWATAQGWGDGLPLIPPTPERVAGFIAAAGRPADSVLLEVPPANAWCTVEKLAVNACMAGAAPEAMPLMMAALEAMAERPVRPVRPQHHHQLGGALPVRERPSPRPTRPAL